MRNCIKCQALIDLDVNFCPRCGAAQPLVSSAEIETLNINKDNLATLPDTIKIPTHRAAATTTDMGKAGARKWRNILLAVGVFVISILIGAALALGLRAYRNRTEPAQPIAANPPVSKAPGPSVVIENPENNENQKDEAKSSSKNGSKEIEKEPKTVTQTAPRAEKPAVTPPEPLQTRPRTVPPVQEDFPGVDPEDTSNATDRGYLAVKFRLSGEALVKIYSGEISVIPLAGSTVGDVQRVVGRPLPSQRCQVRLVQRSTSSVIATLIEEPRARNNYTATIRVTNTAADSRQEALAGFLLGWRLKPRRTLDE